MEPGITLQTRTSLFNASRAKKSRKRTPRRFSETARPRRSENDFGGPFQSGRSVGRSRLNPRNAGQRERELNAATAIAVYYGKIFAGRARMNVAIASLQRARSGGPFEKTSSSSSSEIGRRDTILVTQKLIHFEIGLTTAKERFS